jgi:hypothetical protein
MPSQIPPSRSPFKVNYDLYCLEDLFEILDLVVVAIGRAKQRESGLTSCASPPSMPEHGARKEKSSGRGRRPSDRGRA